ncbi:MAG TPA: methyltransferase domain-containing protein [Stellaceae bacterium]
MLDVGGGHRPFHAATHVLDLQPYETRNTREALDPEQPPRYDSSTWFRHDACKTPWPFPDKFFAFSFCSHLLEDVRDPIAVCAELCRVSRAGNIETPSRAHLFQGEILRAEEPARAHTRGRLLPSSLVRRDRRRPRPVSRQGPAPADVAVLVHHAARPRPQDDRA